MQYRASYYKGSVYSRLFSTLEELEAYNKENNIKNHNLHEELFLSEIIGNGLIVCVEGDSDLEDEELSVRLKTLPNFLMLNNIYDEPQKLLQLKDKVVDTLVIQSTGLKSEAIAKMQEWYISQELPFPKNIITVLGKEDEFLKPLITKAPFEIKVFSSPNVLDDDVELERWIGTMRQSKQIETEEYDMTDREKILANSDTKVTIKISDELPERIKRYYESLSDEDVLAKIKHLTNMEKQMGATESLTDQLLEFKNEADKRNLDYKSLL